MRQRHLKVIFDQSQPLHTNASEAALKAAEHEKSIYDRAKNKTIYVNLVAILIKNLRGQVVEKQQQSSQSSKTTSSQQQSQNGKILIKSSPTSSSSSAQLSSSSSFSHEMMLSGPKATRVNYSIGRAKTLEVKDLSGKTKSPIHPNDSILLI